MTDTKVDKHPAYGVVQFHRINGGGGKLYGSALKRHGTRIELTISRSARAHNLSYDRYTREEELIRVELSAAQFAELLTTMNYGSGTPCTIKRLEGESVEDLVDDDTEVDRVETGFSARCAELADALASKIRDVEPLLDKKRINKGDREDIKRVFRWLHQEVSSNMPYVETSFKEAAERVKSAAKAEVDAFMAHAINVAGIKALSSGEETPLRALDTDEDGNE